jgi:hypothetical protein
VLLNETREYLRRLRLKANEHAFPAQFAGCGVELEETESKAY